MDIGVRPLNSMGKSPWLHSLCCEMSSLTSCKAGRNALVADNAFCEPRNDGGGRSIPGRKGRSISMMCVYSCEDDSLPPPWWERFNVIHLSPCGLLVPQGLVQNPRKPWAWPQGKGVMQQELVPDECETPACVDLPEPSLFYLFPLDIRCSCPLPIMLGGPGSTGLTGQCLQVGLKTSACC